MSTATIETVEPIAAGEAPRARWKLISVLVCVITLAFWFIDHDLKSSEDFEYRSEYRGSVNRTADRVENVNRNSTVARIGLGVFGLAMLMLLPSQRGLHWRGTLLVLLAAYVVYYGCSVLWSTNPRLTVLKLGSLVFFLFAALGLARKLQSRELVMVFSIVCMIYIFIGLLVEISSGLFRPTSSEYRFVGTCHPNILGGYGAVCCLGAAVFSRKGGRVSLVSVAVFAIGVATLVLTKSRTSMFGVVFALAAIRSITLKPGTRLLAYAGMTVVLAGVIGYLAIAGGKGRSSAGSIAAMGRTENMSSLTGRIPLWEELLERIQENPVLGHGYLAYWDKDQVEYLSDVFNWEIPHGHNMYIDVLIDGGIVGLAIFVAILVTGITLSFRRYFDQRSFAMAFAFGMFLFVAIHGIGESLFKLHTFLSLVYYATLMRLGSLVPEQPK